MESESKITEELVLVGSTNYDYVESLKAFIENKKNVWTAWDFKIRNKWRDTIITRIKNNGKFPLFFYMSKRKGGSGIVEYVGIANEILISDTPISSPDKDLTNIGEQNFPTDDFKSYTWFKFTTIERFPLALQSFKDIDSEKPIHPSQLLSSFAYSTVEYDPNELIEEGEPSIIPTAISVERDLRKYLVSNLSSLEDGLKLYFDGNRGGEEYQIESGRMRIDILAKDKSNNFVVIELKAGIADLSTFGQISSYIGWVKTNLTNNGKVRGLIVANDFVEQLKYAVQSVSNIQLKRYTLEFKFIDV